MRKLIIPFALLLTICLLCTACGTSLTSKHIDTTKPKISGEVTYVGAATILIENKEGTYSVVIEAENKDSDTEFHVGDKVDVYYNHKIVSGSPKQIVDVHAIVVTKCVD